MGCGCKKKKLQVVEKSPRPNPNKITLTEVTKETDKRNSEDRIIQEIVRNLQKIGT